MLNCRRVQFSGMAFVLGTALVFSAYLALAQEGGAPEVTASVTKADGVETVEFDTLNGRVEVNLPDDLSETDTISGTVLVEPKGETKEEIAQNEDTLRGYVVEIADTQEVLDPEPPKEAPLTKTEPPTKAPPLRPPVIAHPPVSIPGGPGTRVPGGGCPPVKPPSGGCPPVKPSGGCPKPPIVQKPVPPVICNDPPVINVCPNQPGTYTCDIRPGTGRIRIRIRRRGEEIASQPVTCNPKPPRCPPTKLPGQANCSGRMRIPGKCDGRSFNSRVRVNKKDCQILAESPRQQVCLAPKGLKGRCNIERTEGNTFICGTILMLPPKPVVSHIISKPPVPPKPLVPHTIAPPARRYVFRRTGPFITEKRSEAPYDEMTISGNTITWRGHSGGESINAPMRTVSFSFSDLPQTLAVGDKFNFTGTISGDPDISPIVSFGARSEGLWTKLLNPPLVQFSSSPLIKRADYVPTATETFEITDGKKQIEEFRRKNPDKVHLIKDEYLKQFECVLFGTGGGGRLSAEFKWIYVLEGR